MSAAKPNILAALSIYANQGILSPSSLTVALPSSPVRRTHPGDMNYRRAKTAGGTFFFTVVTHNRRPFLCIPENIALLRQAFRYAMSNHPLRIDAIVILPEHLHSGLGTDRVGVL